MIRKTIRIVNKLGMHARPATMIVKAATKYRSENSKSEKDQRKFSFYWNCHR